MKIGSLFIGVSLMATMAVGVGASLSIQAQTKEAEAARPGRFSILIHKDSWWKNDYAHIYAIYNDGNNFWNSGTTPQRIMPDSDLGSTSTGFTIQDIGGTDYYVLTMAIDYDDFNYGNFYFGRHNPANAVTTGSSSNANDWGTQDWCCNPKGLSSNNAVIVSSSSGFTQDWGNYWKITTYSGKTSYASLAGATKAAYLKSANYEFVPENPSAPTGYEFVGWYTDTSFTKQWTSSSRATADTTLYAKYEAVSVKFDDGDVLTYNSSNSQYEAIKYFDASEKFHIVKTVGSTSTNYAALDSYVPSTVATSDGTDVTVVGAGTYAVYFKSDLTIWLEKSSAEQEAYMYAGYFLDNVGCDEQGIDLPSGWTACANRYATLSDDAKDIFYSAQADKTSADTIKQTAARYDWAVAGHSSLTKFMVNRGGTPRAYKNVSSPIVFADNSTSSSMNPIVLILIASTAALSAIGLLVYTKRRKTH